MVFTNTSKRKKIFDLSLVFNRKLIVRRAQIVSAFDLIFRDMISILRVMQVFLYACQLRVSYRKWYQYSCLIIDEILCVES